MTAQMKPRVSRKGKTTQFCYELPHRANVAKIYPVPAPNGSTIVVYGHSDGLRILWRGGRPLKPSKDAKDSKPKVNGTANDVVMVDLTDDEPVKEPTPTPEEAEFESEEEEEDESAPCPPVIQQLDIPLGAEVLHLAFPHIPTVSPVRPAETIPGIFRKKVVLSVACSDCSVRIVTLPLAPFHDAEKAVRSAQVLSIEGQHGHQSIPTGLSMSWTSREPATFENLADSEDSDDDDVRMIRSRPQSQSGPREWDIVVASHSTELTGLLHIFRIPLVTTGDQHSLSKDPIFPYQTQYLPSPAIQVTFSPAQHPNRRHLQLLVVDMKGSAKIYDPLVPAKVRPRSSHSTSGGDTKLGAWIASFATRYEMPKDSKSGLPGLAQRKRILDAQWASEGGSVVALLSDGEWGAWDVDGLNPGKTAYKSTTKFAVGGYVSTASAQVSTVPPRSSGANRSMALAPMTPNTRRVKEEALFQGTNDSASGVSRGGISVASSMNHSGSRMEDSVIIWHNDNFYRIPNLQAYWSRGTGSLAGPGLILIDGISLHGELCNGVEQFAQKGPAARMGVPRDLLITGEHRIIVLSTTQATGNLFSHTNPIDDVESSRIDQSMLSSGDLDLGGLDRLIDSLGNNSSGPRLLGNGNGNGNGVRKVGFAA